jgi:hypothetical protein
MRVTKHTVDVIRKFERGNTILDVDVENIVVLFPLVQLLAS